MKKIALKLILVLGIFTIMQGCANTQSVMRSPFEQSQGYKPKEEAGDNVETCVVDYSGATWCR